MCVYERERETTEKIECVFLLPVSLAGRTFDATPTVSMPFLRFDDLGNEDELLGAQKMYDFTVAVCLSWKEKLSISVCVCVVECVLVTSRRWLCGTAVKAGLLGGITWNDTQR